MHLLALFILVTSQVAAFSFGSSLQQEPLAVKVASPNCDCTGIENTTEKTDWHLCQNASLGPATLPWRFPLLSLVSNYDRFGKQSPAEFLERWRRPANGTKPASWRYPENDGFQLDNCNQSIKGKMTLPIGYRVDRFGEESGTFISAADAPFAQRALPPDALNVCPRNVSECKPKEFPWNYHVYSVIKPFVVEAGPIAPAFGQPGGGIQFKLSKNILTLVNEKYLAPLKLNQITVGPGDNPACGTNPTNCSCARPK